VGEQFSEEGRNCRSIRNIIVSNTAQHIFPGREGEHIFLDGRSLPAHTLVLGAKSLHLSYGGEAHTLVINNETYSEILRVKMGYAQEGRTNKTSKNA